jgi:hypothetical protein
VLDFLADIVGLPTRLNVEGDDPIVCMVSTGILGHSRLAGIYLHEVILKFRKFPTQSTKFISTLLG